MEEQNEVKSGAIPEGDPGVTKDGKKYKKRSPEFRAQTIRDAKTAKERGRNGGIKSGEAKRAKRDARETIRYMLDQMTKSKSVISNLKELGFEDDSLSNMAALHGRLFAMAMSGDLEAYMLLMKMGGYDTEENRKERESLAADRRRDLEVDAKLSALNASPDDAQIAINMGDEDGNSDVVVYIPKMKDESECQVEDEDEGTVESEA